MRVPIPIHAVPDQEFDFLWNTCNARHATFLGKGRWVRKEGESLEAMLRDRRAEEAESDEGTTRMDGTHEHCRSRIRGN